MLRIFYLVVFACTFAACGGSGSVDGIHYGADVKSEGAISIAEAIANVDAGNGATDLDLGDGGIVKAIPAKVEGQVSDVCKKAGCWLKIAADGKEIFIATDHKFFMPVDIVGKTVAVEGSAYKSVTTVAELQHYAEDEGKSPEEIAKITEPTAEYKILAKGLVIKEQK